MENLDFSYGSLIESFDELSLAYEHNTKHDPQSFVFDDIKYFHISDTENFYLPDGPVDEFGNPLETFSVRDLMKKHFADFEICRKKIKLKNSANTLLLVAQAGRKKVLRMVQLHYQTPQITDATKNFSALFDYFSSRLDSCWKVRQEYNSAFWATNDHELAVAQLLYYGWAPTYTAQVPGINFYKLQKRSEGISITFYEPHSVTDRFYAACSKALQTEVEFNAMGSKTPFLKLYTEAIKTFYGYEGYSVSLPNNVRRAVTCMLQAFCNDIIDCRISKHTPFVPNFQEPEPEDFMPVEYDDITGMPCEYLLKWEDFEFSTSTDAQITHVKEIAHAKTQDAFYVKWDAAQLGEGEYTNEQLKDYFAPRLLASAREKNFLILARKEGRTKFWKINKEGAI